MEYRPRKNSIELSQKQGEEFMEIILVKKVNLLKKLVAGYNRFLGSQKIHFQSTYRNLDSEQILVQFYGKKNLIINKKDVCARKFGLYSKFCAINSANIL